MITLTIVITLPLFLSSFGSLDDISVKCAKIVTGEMLFLPESVTQIARQWQHLFKTEESGVRRL